MAFKQISPNELMREKNKSLSELVMERFSIAMDESYPTRILIREPRIITRSRVKRGTRRPASSLKSDRIGI